MTMTAKKELAEAREVCPTTSHRMMNEGALIIDVREPAEVARVGYAGGDVINIPLSQIEDRWAEVPRDRDVIFACAVGERSLKATYFLMFKGYDNVMNMQIGIGRWIARGFPITGSAEGVAASEAASSCCGGSDAAVAPSLAGEACGCGEGAGADGCC